MKKFLVYVCLECNRPILLQLDFIEYSKKCCLEFKNHKLLKVFNDESEAKNYLEQIKQEE